MSFYKDDNHPEFLIGGQAGRWHVYREGESKAVAGPFKTRKLCIGWMENPPIHFDHQTILDLAHDLGEGWRKTTLTLGSEDTAISMLSHKWQFQGPGTVEYLIHASGCTITPGEGVRKQYI
ncbi:hypothetical protein [Rhodococcus phage RGL3]|uniref:Uncharacterized protein n=1 Tax=Rhodococcus phage RGL3 TaxID=2922221 RepID=G9FHQ0_9CAUD|nr:hypothetical protein RoPhRGL3_gp58 [Rhodococcus phage RGL3]AEV52138.1 hypothetical protein [Rhodococcus phage RGL3]